jgi:gpW
MTTAELLADARAAYHRLTTGTAVVTVRDQHGETVTYQFANAPRLAAYIADLERLLEGRRPVLSILFNTSKGI